MITLSRHATSHGDLLLSCSAADLASRHPADLHEEIGLREEDCEAVIRRANFDLAWPDTHALPFYFYRRA